jgi:hypothetical protein
MARYCIRMELHKVSNRTVQESDYEILHEEMAKKNFYPSVSYEGDSAVYILPTGTYRKMNDDTLDKTEKDAIEAGTETVRRSPNVVSFSFFLVDYNNSRKYNLKKRS